MQALREPVFYLGSRLRRDSQFGSRSQKTLAGQIGIGGSSPSGCTKMQALLGLHLSFSRSESSVRNEINFHELQFVGDTGKSQQQIHQKKYLAPNPASMPKPVVDVSWSDGTSSRKTSIGVLCGIHAMPSTPRTATEASYPAPLFMRPPMP